MSIKRKFATAVATASLLAGLFGSALVSTASAAGRIGGSGTVSTSRSEIYSGDSDIEETVASTDDGTDYKGTLDLFFDISAANINEAPDVDQEIHYYFETSGGSAVTSVQNLKATSSSSVIDVAWMYNNDGTAATDCEDNDIGDGANWSTSDVVEGAGDDAAYLGWAGGYVLCFYPNRAGKATITVVADGVTLPAVTVTAFGDLTTLTLAVRNGHNYIADGNAEVASYFTVVAKDSAGQVMNAAGSGAYSQDGDLEYWDISEAAANPQFADDADANFFSEDDYTDPRGETDYSGFYSEEDDDFEYGLSAQKYALQSGVCATADAGKTYALAVEAVNDDGDDVTSNTVSITCTGDEAKVTDLSVEATGGARKYNETGIYQNDELSILATIVDQANRPMGVGVTVNFDVSIDGDSSLNETAFDDIDFNGATYNGAPLGNKVRVGYLEPDVSLKAVYPYSVTLANSDLGADDEVVYSEDFTYTVDASVVEKTYTISVVKNAAKTRATMTVNFGASCSRQMVDFDVELANGDVKYLTRRADINGVAKLTMERRNTKIYVTAFCGGDPITGYDLESSLRGVRFR